MMSIDFDWKTGLSAKRWSKRDRLKFFNSLSKFNRSSRYQQFFQLQPFPHPWSSETKQKLCMLLLGALQEGMIEVLFNFSKLYFTFIYLNAPFLSLGNSDSDSYSHANFPSHSHFFWFFFSLPHFLRKVVWFSLNVSLFLH